MGRYKKPGIDLVVLAGGHSSRMGADKALIEWEGETLLARTTRVCREAESGRVFIIVRDGLLPPEYRIAAAGATFLPDEAPDAGPLGGLASILADLDSFNQIRGFDRPWPPHPRWIALLPCDMPLLTPDALRWLIASTDAAIAADQSRSGVASVTSDGRVQPLFSCYSTALLPVVRERLAAGRRSLVGLIEAEGDRFARLPVPDEIAASLVSVNTPGELGALRGGQ